jgi:hypothetical protein
MSLHVTVLTFPFRIVASLGSSKSQVPTAALAGSIVGALLLGVLLGAVIFWWFTRPQHIGAAMQRRKDSGIEPYPLSTANSEFIGSRPTTEVGEVMSRPDSPHSRMLPTGAMTPQMVNRQMSDGSSHQVYVVHHDGGRPPISVYHPEGAEVVELPPTYGPRSPVDEPRSGRRQASQKLRVGSGGSTTGSV